MDTSRIAITDDQKIIQEKIDKLIQRAVNAWCSYSTRGGAKRDKSSYYYNQALRLAQAEAVKLGYSVKFDYPGLYPTFEITKNGQNFTEYTTENFFKNINGFWGF